MTGSVISAIAAATGLTEWVPIIAAVAAVISASAHRADTLNAVYVVPLSGLAPGFL